MPDSADTLRQRNTNNDENAGSDTANTKSGNDVLNTNNTSQTKTVNSNVKPRSSGTVTNTTNSSSVNSNNQSTSAVSDKPLPTFFYIFVTCISMAAFNFAQNHYQALKTEENGTWDPTPKNMPDNEVRILFCDGWAHGNVYRQVKMLIQERADKGNLIVNGYDYPVAPSTQFKISCFSFFQMVLFSIVFFGIPFFEHVLQVSNIKDIPAFVKLLGQHKIQSFLFIWLVGNMISMGMSNSGAFEIYYQDKEIYSAMKNGGQLPNLNNILRGSEKAGLKLMKSVSDYGG